MGLSRALLLLHLLTLLHLCGCGRCYRDVPGTCKGRLAGRNCDVAPVYVIRERSFALAQCLVHRSQPLLQFRELSCDRSSPPPFLQPYLPYRQTFPFAFLELFCWTQLHCCLPSQAHLSPCSMCASFRFLDLMKNKSFLVSAEFRLL